jgi:hypothetical protein
MIKEDDAPPPTAMSDGLVGGVPGGIPGGQIGGVMWNHQFEFQPGRRADFV